MADVEWLSAEQVYEPNANLRNEAHIKSMDEYQRLYKQSVENPEAFWGELAKTFYWKSPPTGKFLEYNFDVNKGPISIKWMQGAVTNVCYNVLDRHVENGLGEKVAFYWEGNDPEDSSQITYGELLKATCKFANVLKSKGVKKGDRVAIYMPMIVELVVAMLACARIGAMHSIVFGGFSSVSLADRILDAKCDVLVTSDAVWRGAKLINLKQISDEAMSLCTEKGHAVKTCIVVRHLSPTEEQTQNNTNASSTPGKRPCAKIKVNLAADRDSWYHEEMAGISSECEPEWLDAEHPLFMLYTSGSTGKPKGVVHTQAGYLLYTAATTKYVFDIQPDDVYWCTADIGWITGHSYITYGPMANGATGILFEGVPLYPDPGRYWEVVDKRKVTKFYTAPTAIRALMKFGDSYVKKYNRQSLKVLGTVGEPINPEAWMWYHKVVGDEKCSIVDTFWQTETGGHTITPLPGCTPTKPGSATFPFFGIVPALMTEEGKEITEPGVKGYLVFKQPWPGMMRTVYGDHARFEETYFKKFPGCYMTGDGAIRDKDGYYWITGRIDDNVNVSGHLMSTAEVESALIEHPAVSEAAVVSLPHAVKGECLYCYVTLKEGFSFSDELAIELKEKVSEKIGKFARPDFLQEAPGLPKTRSGKIMRRVLRKIARNDHDLGDVSTMADESVIEVLYKHRPNHVDFPM